MDKAWHSIEEVPRCFFQFIHQISRWYGLKTKKTQIQSILSKITRLFTAIKSLRFALLECNIDLLAPRRCRRNLKFVIFNLTSRIDILSISCEITLKWMTKRPHCCESTLRQVMACCHQTTRHYMSQRWHRSMLLYGWCHSATMS